MKKYLLPLILILCLTFTLAGYCVTYSSQYPPEQSDTYVKATTYVSVDYYPHFATDPTKSLTGVVWGNSWTSLGEVTNQRFHIDLGSAKYIRRIYYENGHHQGAFTTRGPQNFTFWGSNIGAGSFDDLVYANDEGWTELTVSQNTFDQHVAAGQADPKYITVTNSTAYRYYAPKFADNHGDIDFMTVRRIELQTEFKTLRPNDAGDETSIARQVPTSGSHWDKVDEEVADDASTYVKSTSGNNSYERDLYNIPDSGIGSGIINKITIYIRCRRNFEAYAKCSIRTHDTTYDGDEKGPIPFEWTNYYQVWTSNPNTSLAWTWDEIDALQIGVSLRAGGTEGGRNGRCTQVYVEVAYAPAPPTVTNALFFGANF